MDFTQPTDISDNQLASRSDPLDRMPRMKDIPGEHKVDGRWERRFWTQMLSNLVNQYRIELVPSDGINPLTAWRHLSAIVASDAPEQDHKEAALSYLTSLWFQAGRWETIDGTVHSSDNWSGR